MTPARRCTLALALAVQVLALSAAAAEPAAVTAALRPASTPLPDAAAAPAHAASGPHDKRVLEDSQVRIEETRLRGQAQVVTVQSKLPGVKAYEVIMPPLGKDPTQDKGAAGKRTWSIFDF